MEVNERNIKMWSTIGSRATFGMGALDLAKKIDNLMVLTCDVSTSAGLDRFRKQRPDKYSFPVWQSALVLPAWCCAVIWLQTNFCDYLRLSNATHYNCKLY